MGICGTNHKGKKNVWERKYAFSPMPKAANFLLLFLRMQRRLLLTFHFSDGARDLLNVEGRA